MAERRVTVVVISHNRCEELERTLTALARLPERPAVVVVDNGSTDGTAEMVRARFREFGLLVSPENLGAAARNHGVGAVRTPYVAFCDDDTWYAAGALTRAADLLAAHPRLAVVTASILVEPSGTPDPRCDEMARSPLEPQPGMPGRPLLSFPAGVSIVRRQAFLDAGGFCERLWHGGEEDLLAADLARQGWCITYVPAVVAHRYPAQHRDARRRRRHAIRNALWFTWLRRPVPSAVMRTIRLLRRLPRDRTTLAALTDALRGVPWVLRERAVVPPHIERGYRELDHRQPYRALVR